MKTRFFSARLAVLPFALASAFSVFGQTQLKEVFVTASRSEQSFEAAPIGSSIIFSEEILRSGVVDANEAVRMLGGVWGRRDLNGGREAVLDMRAYGDSAANNLVVLVDGIRISENELASARLSAISPEMIDRIEIVRGSASVLWGEGASAGVINVLTKTGANVVGTKGSVVLGVESFGGRDARADIYSSSQGVSMSAQVRSYKTDGYRQNSQHSNDAVNIGVSFGDRSTLKTKLSANFETLDMRWPGALPYSDYLISSRQTIRPNDFGKQDQSRWTLSLEKQIDSTLVAVDFSRKDKNSQSYQDWGFGTDERIHSESISYQLSPRASWTQDFGGSLLNTTVGADFNQWEYKRSDLWSDPSWSSNEKGIQTSQAAYARTDLLLASKWRINAGLRFEEFQRTLDKVTSGTRLEDKPSLSAVELGVSRILDERWTAYTRFATSYRVANVDEFRNLTNALLPQQAKDLEAGARYRHGTSTFGVRIFQQRTRDEIAYDDSLFANVNLDPVLRRGLEVEGAVNMSKNLKISAVLQAIRAQLDGGSYAGKDLPLAPKMTSLLRASYLTDEGRNSFDFSMRTVGAAPFGNDWNNTCPMSIPQANFFDLGYRFKSALDSGWSVRIGVENLLDKQSFSTGYTNAACGGYNVYPDLGRSFKLSTSYSFK
jgi:iron complex outermembrane receptor protein